MYLTIAEAAIRTTETGNFAPGGLADRLDNLFPNLEKIERSQEEQKKDISSKHGYGLRLRLS